ncbi:MAG: hypothetical protein AAF478_04105 [Pseudomonadota bacterium]
MGLSQIWLALLPKASSFLNSCTDISETIAKSSLSPIESFVRFTAITWHDWPIE